MNLVLINSATNPVSSLVTGNYIRSIYTSEERFLQTIESIKSAKIHIPNCKIMLLEATPLSDEQKQAYTELCDVIDLSNIVTVKQFVNGKNKSLGEAITMYHGLKFVLTTQIEYSMIFKLCSRNVFNENFNIKNFLVDKFSFRQFENHIGQWYSSGFYTIPWQYKWVYLDSLFNSVISMVTEKIPDMEGNLFKWIPENMVNIVNPIGISGTGGANKVYFEH